MLHQAERNDGGIHQELGVSTGKSTDCTHPRERQGSGKAVGRRGHSWALRISSSTGQKTRGREYLGKRSSQAGETPCSGTLRPGTFDPQG